MKIPELSDPQEKKKIKTTMMKYGEIFMVPNWHLTPAALKSNKICKGCIFLQKM